jgi:hypothetical protein
LICLILINSSNTAVKTVIVVISNVIKTRKVTRLNNVFIFIEIVIIEASIYTNVKYGFNLII